MPDWQQRTLDDPTFKAAFPFEHRYVDLDGHRIHYVDEGTGPTLLLLHGNPTFSFLYRHIIGGLKDRFRLVALDYPGFGLSIARPGYDHLPESQSRVVERFVAALGLSDLTLFVQDWGGPIGLGFAGRNPGRVSRVIVGNTWAWPVNGDFHFESFSWAMGGPIGRVLIRNFNAFVGLMIPAGTPMRPLSKELLAVYRGVMPRERRFATSLLPRQIVQGKRFLQEVADGLGALADKPALILWGDKDIAFRPKERARFEGIFRNHATVILEGAGHYVQEEMPEEICARIVEWWPG